MKKCGGELHYESIQGIRVSREVEGKQVYQARCAKCGRITENKGRAKKCSLEPLPIKLKPGPSSRVQHTTERSILMKRKGIHFKYAPHLTFRDGDPERDFRTDGRPVDKHYCVIVPWSKVDPDENGGKTWDQVKKAPCIPFSGHSRTNMVYGSQYRKQTRGRWFWVQTKPTLNPAQFKAAEAAGDDNPEGWEQQWFDVYWTSTTYWVEDGSVYTATDHHYKDPTARKEAA